MFDGRFWAGYFRRIFAKQISHFCAAVEARFLPTFDSLEAEAEAAKDAEWERLGQIIDPEYADEATLAEQAHEVGIDYYMSMERVRQTLINLSVAALYHLFEQQLLLFHRRQVLHPKEENDKDLINTKEFKTRLSVAGLQIETLKSWAKIEELRVVANTIKHAEGTSADKLRQLRPDLFAHPQTRGTTGFDSLSMSRVRVYMPLAGEDIFLTVADLKAYCTTLLEFWEEFGAAIQ